MRQGGRFLSISILVLFSVITIWLSSLLPKIPVQKTVDIFYDKSGGTYRKFQSWEDLFGSDDRVIVAWRSPTGFDHTAVSTVIALTEKLESLDGVEEVKSLSTVSDIWGEGYDFYANPPFSNDVDSDLLQLKDRILFNPIFVDNLISKDGTVFSWIVFLEPHISDKSSVIESIINTIKTSLNIGEYHLSGSAIVDYYYTKYMENDLRTFLPLVLLFIFLVLLITFRSIGGVLFPFLTILVSLVWTMSLLYFFGFAINNVTTIIPPIIVAIGIADSIHFVAEVLQRRRIAPEKRFSDVLSGSVLEIFKPCFLTSITTAIGFASLSVSRIEPVRQMGIVASIGVIFALVITFTVLPSLLFLFPSLLDKRFEFGTVAWGRFSFDRFLYALIEFDRRWIAWILISAVILVGGSLYYARRIKTETSMINYFKKNTEVYKSTVFIQNTLGGIHFINISLRAPKEDYFMSVANLRRLENLEEKVGSLPKVDKVLSVVEYLKLMNRALHSNNQEFFALPERDSTVKQYLLLYDLDDLRDFVNDEWNWVTVQVRTHENSSLGLMKLVGEIKEITRTLFPNREVEVSVVGRAVLAAETNELVSQGQIKSLSLAFVLIFILMFLVFRSIRVGILSMVPNIIPLILNFGIMGAFGIRLDSATSMISAVGIGIIVDDTIHFLHTLIKNLKQLPLDKAVDEVIMEKGRPIIFTSVILFFGFVILSLSRFSPTAAFGVLTSVLMVNALISDLLILPAILYILARLKGRSS